MEWFSKSKGKKSPETRGLSDHHPYIPHSSSPTSHVSVPIQASALTTSLSLIASPGLATAVPYEAPHHAEHSEPREVNFFVGGNENTNLEGEQETDEVEVGTSSNGVVSPIFGNNGGKIDIKIGNNVNAGRVQKIGKVKFGNAG